MAIIPNKNLKDHELRDVLNKDGGKTDNVYGSKFRQSAFPTIYAKPEPPAPAMPTPDMGGMY